jgi:hypothetical protein
MNWLWLLYLPGGWLGGYLLSTATDCSRGLRPWQRPMVWLIGGLLWPLVLLYFVIGLMLLVLEWRSMSTRQHL